jgi:hypothetical protein
MLDSYAFGVLVLELLTGKTGMEVVSLSMMEPEFFKTMSAYVDSRAAWPKKAATRLAKVGEGCLAYNAHARTSVRDVLPALEALAKAHKIPLTPRQSRA